MWKPEKSGTPSSMNPPPPTQTNVPTSNANSGNTLQRAMEAPKTADPFREVAHIGKSVLVKGALSGSEDLYLDGEGEGCIDLGGYTLATGPNGRVRANIHARELVV